MSQSICFVILVVLVLPYISTGVELRCCRKPPPLIINGKNVFEEKEGSHILVAFVEGTNKDSRKQVRGLDLLLHNFKNMDVLDINFIAINRKNDSGIRHLRRKAEFDVYQEPEESNVLDEMKVGTNDFIILDHCGYMVGSTTFPNNSLVKQKGRVCTDKLIRNTYTKIPCKKFWKCPRTYPYKIEEGRSRERDSDVFSIIESSGENLDSPTE